MTEDPFKPMDLNAFLRNSQYLEGDFKESVGDHFIRKANGAYQFVDLEGDYVCPSCKAILVTASPP